MHIDTILSSKYNLLSDAGLADVEGDGMLLPVRRTDSRISLPRELPQLSGHLLASTEWQLKVPLGEQLRNRNHKSEREG